MALKDITLGQYFPGNSLLHRLDPRTKILAVVLYIVALFLAKHFFTYAIMFCVLALSIALSHVPLKSLFRGMKPVVFILIFTAVLNLFYTPGEHVLFHFWILTVTMEGVVNAFFMVIRILMLIAGTFLLTYTTSPILLTAMECRCYHGGEGRTRLRQLRYAARDWAVLAFFLAVALLVWVLGRFGL